MSEGFLDKWRNRFLNAWGVLVGRLVACDPAILRAAMTDKWLDGAGTIADFVQKTRRM